MIKMVVSSFYNTLIDDTGAISKNTMLEIERIRNKGIIFSVCTNRLYKEVEEYNRDFPFIDYIISLNGSCVYDVKKQRSFLKKKLTVANLKKIDKAFKDYNKYYYSMDKVYNDYKDIEDKDIEIYKVEIEINDDNVEDKLENINVNTSYITISQVRYLEIISHKVNMFTGVDQIGLKNSIDLEDILVICANESDYSLTRNIKNTFVMKNGAAILKKQTRRRTDNNNDDGVCRILKRIK